MSDILYPVRKKINIQQLYWVIPILLVVIYLVFHIRIIAFPFQHEYREGAIVLTTDALLNHINPYQAENSPLYTNVYGIFYNFIAFLFATAFGNSISLHRFLSAIFIFGQIGLVVLVLRKQKISWLLTVIAGLFIWVGQLFYTSPLARPDAMGEFLFLASLFVPFLCNFNLCSLIVASIVGIFGFYTKPYFILGIPILLSYVFLFVSKKQALVTGISSLMGFLLTLFLINQIFETYFLNTFYSHIAYFNDSVYHLFLQIFKYLRDFWSVLVISSVEIISSGIAFIKKRSPRNLNINIPHLDAPLIHPSMNFFLFSLLITTPLIIFKLGRHSGNTMVYFYQFITPFVLLLFMKYVNLMTWKKGLVIVLLLVNLATHSFENLSPDFRPYFNTGWEQLTFALNDSSKVINSPVSVSILLENDMTLTNSGQSEYYFPLPTVPSFYYPEIVYLKDAGENYLNAIKRGVSLKQFDLIMLENPTTSDIETFGINYQFENMIAISMPHTMQTWNVQIWKPK